MNNESNPFIFLDRYWKIVNKDYTAIFHCFNENDDDYYNVSSIDCEVLHITGEPFYSEYCRLYPIINDDGKITIDGDEVTQITLTEYYKYFNKLEYDNRTND